MESGFDVVNALLVGVALAAATYIVAALLSTSAPVIGEAARGVIHGLTDVFAINARSASDGRRKRYLRDEIDAELGRHGQWVDPDAGIIASAEITQTITAVDRRLRTAVRDCYTLHWQLADTLKPESMAPVATFPVVQRSRLRILDLAELLTNEIAIYPLLEKSPELIALGFGARRLAICCESCPYFTCDVYDAPKPCPALAAVSKGDRGNDGIRDAEIVP